VYIHCTHDINGTCLFLCIGILGFGISFLNISTCFRDIGIIIWILGNVNLFGGLSWIGVKYGWVYWDLSF
jgi:hypothetical protein